MYIYKTNYQTKDFTVSISETSFSSCFKTSSTTTSCLNFTSTKCLNSDMDKFMEQKWVWRSIVYSKRYIRVKSVTLTPTRYHEASLFFTRQYLECNICKITVLMGPTPTSPCNCTWSLVFHMNGVPRAPVSFLLKYGFCSL